MQRASIVLLTLLYGAPAVALEPSESVARALVQFEAKRYSLARTYLDPVVLDPRLSGIQRARAYYLRGFTFLAEGLYVSAAQDYQRALALDPDNAAVLTELGRLYSEGTGVDKDLEQAFRMLLKAARAGSAQARQYVGYALLTGTGTTRDVKRARYWLRESADAGHVESLVQLARSYRAPFSSPPDIDRALELYQRAVDAGSTDAMTAVGYMYLGTEVGRPDKARATAYFRQAAEKNAPAAQVALGYVYLADAQYAKAKGLFEQALAQQDAAAYAGLGLLYQRGQGVPANRARALELYATGAALGDVQSQILLASMQMKPPASEASTESALRWLRLAAAQGHPQGYNGVAWLLATTRFDRLRDGATAITQARRATELARSAQTLDTLAAAYAETGDFDQAIATQREAIAAITAEEGAMRAELEKHLASYMKHHAWRE